MPAGTMLKLSVVAAVATTSLARIPSDPAPVSTSIDGLADYDRTMPFVNLMKSSRPFGSAQSPYDGNCTVDAQGWPTQDSFGVVLLTQNPGLPPTGVYINGTYSVYAQGNAVVSEVLGNGVLLNSTYDPSSNRLTVFFDILMGNSGLVWLAFRNASRGPGLGAGLTNISVLQPGYGYDRVDDFTDPFLTLLGRFDSLRFMDWLSTNDNPQTSWSNRSTPDTVSYVAHGTGVPWETVIALGNRVQRDIWVNIPAMVDDVFITNVAKMLYAGLDPSLTILYEYSNEVWNWQFSQATYNLHAANASVLAGDPYSFNYDGCNNTGYWAWRRTAYMAKHIADIFASVFGPDNVGPGKRVQPIFSAQAGYDAPLSIGLQYLYDVYGPITGPSVRIAHTALAPYFNLGPWNQLPNLTTDQVIYALNSSITNMSATDISRDNPLASQMALTAFHRIQMRAYEGGPDTSGPNDPISLYAKGNASIDTRMTELGQRYLTTWAQWGDPAMVGPLNWFVAGATTLYEQYGVYGILYDMTIPVTPKTLAIDGYRVNPRPAPIVGLPIPATVNCSYYAGHPNPVVDPYLRYLGVNDTFIYFVRNDGTQTVQVTVTAWTSGQGSPVAGLEIGLDDTHLQVIQVSPSGDWNTPSAQPPAAFTMPPGVSGIRLRVLADRAYNVWQLVVTQTSTAA